MPLAFYTKAVDLTLWPRAIALISFCLFTLIGALVSARFRWHFSWPFVIYALYISWSARSMMQASSPFLCFEQLAGDTLIGITYLLLFSLYRSRLIQVKDLLLTVVIFGSISILKGTFQLSELSGLSPLEVNTMNAISGNKNLFASLLLLVLPTAGYLFYRYRTLIERIWIGVILAASAIFVLILETRAVWLAIFLAVPFSFLFFHDWFAQRKRFLLIAFIPVAMISLIAIAPSYFNQQKEPNSAETRVRLWTKSTAILDDNKLYGVGPGKWKLYYAQYGLENLKFKAQQGLIHYQRAHNDILQCFAERGYIGGVLFLSFLLIGLFKLNGLHQHPIRYYLAFTIVAFGVISFFDFPNERFEHRTFFLFALTICPQRTFYAPVKSFRNMTQVASVLILLTLCFIVIMNKIHAEVVCRKIKDGELSAKISQTKLKYLDNIATPLFYYDGVNALRNKNLTRAKASFINSIGIYPYHLPSLNNLAYTLVQLKQYDEALETFNRALLISPNNEEVKLNKALALLHMGNNQAAIETINTCTNKMKNPLFDAFKARILSSEL